MTELFTESVFVLMIVHDKDEVIACRMLPRYIGFSALPIHRCPLCVSIPLSGTEQNATEQKTDYSTFMEHK